MIDLLTQYWPTFLEGFKTTILCSLIALFFSLIIGVIFALLEISPIKPLRIIGQIYVEIIRNIPILIITMVFFLIIPRYFIKINGFTAGTIGLTIYTSAFIAETVRAGINSVNTGQMEGARSNGLSYVQAMRYVVLPQAISIVIPPLGNQLVNMIKNSSVLAFVAGMDLMYQGTNMVANTTFKFTESYLIIGAFYLVLTLPLSYWMRHLEKKQQSKGAI